MIKNSEQSLEQRGEQIFLWIDEYFVCSLFKPDLGLEGFFASANMAVSFSWEAFDRSMAHIDGDEAHKRRMKYGFRQFIMFLKGCKNLVPGNYEELSGKEKWSVNCRLAQGIIESSRLLLSINPDWGNELEQEVRRRQTIYANWKKGGEV